jgi:hypothetical protein
MRSHHNRADTLLLQSCESFIDALCRYPEQFDDARRRAIEKSPVPHKQQLLIQRYMRSNIAVLDSKFELMTGRVSFGIKAMNQRAKEQYDYHVGKRRAEYDVELLDAALPETSFPKADENVPTPYARRVVRDSVLNVVGEDVRVLNELFVQAIIGYREVRRLQTANTPNVPIGRESFDGVARDTSELCRHLYRMTKDYPQVFSEKRQRSLGQKLLMLQGTSPGLGLN